MKRLNQTEVWEVLEHQGVTVQALKPLNTLDEFYAEIDRVNRDLMETVREDLRYCQTCKGLGIVNRDGQLVICPENDCESARQNRYDYLMRMAHNMKATIDPLDNEQGMTFKRYQAGMKHPQQSIALGVAFDLLKSYPRGIEYMGTIKNSLMFYGETGSGKTALSSAFVNESLHRGRMAFFTRIDDIMAAIRSTFARNGEESKFTTEQMIRFFAKTEILAMDEFDMLKISDYDLQQIERIINHRCDNNLITIMTTNSTQEDFQTRWGYRIHSRVVGMAHWVPINGVMRNQNKPIGA